MGTTLVKAQIIDQTLQITSKPKIASGGVNEIIIEWTFCDLWEGCTKTAIFYMDEKQPYYALISADNVCTIPHEAVANDGVLNFGVFGADADGVMRTSEIARYKIVKGAITEGLQPSDPTPELWQQALTIMQDARAAQQKFETENRLGIDPVTNNWVLGGKDTGFPAFAPRVYFKWSAVNPTKNSDIKDTPDAYIGVYVGKETTAPTDYTKYKWYCYKGDSMTMEKITEEVTAQLATLTPADIGASSNENLIDNWYFADPVNSRGLTEYNFTNEYTVDRWKGLNKGVLTIGNEELTLISVSGYPGYVRQHLNADIAKMLVGQKITFSALVKGYGRAHLFAEPGVGGYGEYKQHDDWDVITLTYTVPADCTSIFSGLNTSDDGTSAMQIKAVKLELGDKQTLARQDANGNWILNDPPPDKGMELLKCIQSTADPADTYANKVILHAGNKNLITPDDIGALDITSGGTAIPSGANLDEYLTPGVYRSASSTNSATLTNPPWSNAGFKLIVIKHYSTTGIMQLALPQGATVAMNFRYYESSKWTGWRSFYDSGNKPTPAGIGAVNKAGDIMAGALELVAGSTIGGNAIIHVGNKELITKVITTTKITAATNQIDIPIPSGYTRYRLIGTGISVDFSQEDGLDPATFNFKVKATAPAISSRIYAWRIGSTNITSPQINDLTSGEIGRLPGSRRPNCISFEVEIFKSGNDWAGVFNGSGSSYDGTTGSNAGFCYTSFTSEEISNLSLICSDNITAGMILLEGLA